MSNISSNIILERLVSFDVKPFWNLSGIKVAPPKKMAERKQFIAIVFLVLVLLLLQESEAASKTYFCQSSSGPFFNFHGTLCAKVDFHKEMLQIAHACFMCKCLFIHIVKHTSM